MESNIIGIRTTMDFITFTSSNTRSRILFKKLFSFRDRTENYLWWLWELRLNTTLFQFMLLVYSNNLLYVVQRHIM